MSKDEDFADFVSSRWLAGGWWHPVTVEGDEEDLDDYEQGTLTVLSRSRALFESDGIEVEFEPGPNASTTCR